MRNVHLGSFHRIEGPLIVAVIGILLVTAIPAWQDYKVKSRVADAIASANPARSALARVFAEQGPADMSLRASARWTPPVPTEDVQSVSISKAGAITIGFTPKIAPAGENEIQIVPVANGTALDLSEPANKGRKFDWECGGAAGKSTLRKKYRPTDCRG